MWYYSPTKNKFIYIVRANTYDFWLSGQYGKFNSNIFLFHPLGPFPSKMMRCPEFYIWSPPITAEHRFDAWDMAVPGLYISWRIQNIFNIFLKICIEKKMFNFSDLRLGSITWKISPWEASEKVVKCRGWAEIKISRLEFRI